MQIHTIEKLNSSLLMRKSGKSIYVIMEIATKDELLIFLLIFLSDTAKVDMAHQE